MTGTQPLSWVVSKRIGQFERDLAVRLEGGQHLILYGPRGGGKSALMNRLHMRFRAAGVPCALSTATSCLEDITRTLAAAYPQVDTAGLTRRRTRSRLRAVADHRPGVLLLDNLTYVGTAMLGFLRRLRGGVVAVLVAADVDVVRDLHLVDAWHLGSQRLRMPLLSPRQLHRLFSGQCAARHIAPIAPDRERRIVSAARGRPGWIIECVDRLVQPRYWRDGMLLDSTLCIDTEIVLRQGELDLLLPGREEIRPCFGKNASMHS